MSGLAYPIRKSLLILRQHFDPYFTEGISDDKHSSDSEDELLEMGQLKALTPFCADSAKWQSNLSKIQKILAAYNTTSCGRTVVHKIMDSLIQIFANHGQAFGYGSNIILDSQIVEAA